jgi:hypothetical protein
MEVSMTEIETSEAQARAAQRAKAAEWFADGNTWVGLFANKDRGSLNFGARVGLPFDLDAMPIVEVAIGKTRAPQLEKLPNAHNFVLIAICRDADEVVAEMFREDPANDDKPGLH